MKYLIILAASLIGYPTFSQNLIPLEQRVNIQSDSTCLHQIIDNKWVCVGVKKEYAIQHDYNLQFEGKPSYRFELKEQDNTLSGYSKGETKGRAEMSYCYVVSSDFHKLSPDVFHDASILKTVYHYGKGACKQGSSMTYRFSIYIPKDLSPNVSTIT